MRGNPSLGLESTTDLRIPHLLDGPVPALYLEGVIREGTHSQRISDVIEIWKGRYKDKVVMLRVLELSRQYPYTLEFKMVSIRRNPPWSGLFVVVLTGDTAILRGSGDNDTVQAR